MPLRRLTKERLHILLFDFSLSRVPPIRAGTRLYRDRSFGRARSRGGTCTPNCGSLTAGLDTRMGTPRKRPGHGRAESAGRRSRCGEPMTACRIAVSHF